MPGTKKTEETQKRAAVRSRKEYIMKKPYDIVLFDLDGTLCETGEGIRNSIRHALGEMNRPVPPEEVLRRFIGPPLWDSFRDFCGMNQEESDEGVRRFRAYYNTIGWLQTRLFDGMADLLADLQKSGVRVATATSKPEAAAQRILEHVGVAPYFQAVVGSLPDGARSLKKELIPYAMERCSAKPGDRVVMVGDTHFDVQGANEMGIPFIGVLYGYGTREEMEAQGAQVFAQSVEQLRGYLLP